MKMHWQILIALALAVAAGAASGPGGSWLPAFDFVGRLFLNALFMLIVPLVVCAIINGLSGSSGARHLGRIGLRTLAYYAGTGLLAILTGLLMVNWLRPGIVDGAPAGPRLGLAEDTGQLLQRLQGYDAGDMLGVLQQLFPPNLIAAASEGNIVGLIVFSLLFGFFVNRLPEDLAGSQRRFWQGAYEVMSRITRLVMRFAPVGVFALVAAVVARTGWEALRPLALFFAAVLLGLLAHALVTLPLVLRLVARVSPLQHYRAMSPALLTAFSTSSSAATLPVTIDCVERRAGVSKRVTGFVLPIGANVNTDGTALYECAAALFIAQAYGLELGLAGQFVVVMIALLTGFGMAGIPSASLVAIGVILTAVGLPLEGVGLILAVDRLLDMCRTAVNVLGDGCAAVVVGRLEGEAGILAKPVS
ncbi:MAG TPA: dicarboxylate/amino acid:cation symporter [Nevskiales bacterium]|nr:dicarboxylate/amino acid:cation symporter [Nevskiales bacterium]